MESLLLPRGIPSPSLAFDSSPSPSLGQPRSSTVTPHSPCPSSAAVAGLEPPPMPRTSQPSASVVTCCRSGSQTCQHHTRQPRPYTTSAAGLTSTPGEGLTTLFPTASHATPGAATGGGARHACSSLRPSMEQLQLFIRRDNLLAFSVSADLSRIRLLVA